MRGHRTLRALARNEKGDRRCAERRSDKSRAAESVIARRTAQTGTPPQGLSVSGAPWPLFGIARGD
jgi:hypothetical protein